MKSVFIAQYTVTYEGSSTIGVGSTFEKAAEMCTYIPYQSTNFTPKWSHPAEDEWVSQPAGYGFFEIHEWKIDE